MKDYILDTTDRFLSPTWMNTYYGGSLHSEVGEDGLVDAHGVKLRFIGEALPAGTKVYVSLGRRFSCCTKDDWQAEEDRKEQTRQEYARAALQHQEDLRQKKNRWRAEAEAFNASLNIPAKWDVGIKDVLSGLSANSNGDGRSRSTVEHILLLEDLTDGRLKRGSHDFLCSAGGKNGKNWTGQKPERFTDGDGKEYMPRVTCKKCLEVAARWATTKDGQSNK